MPFPLLSKVGLHLCLILWILFQNAAASPAPRYTGSYLHNPIFKLEKNKINDPSGQTFPPTTKTPWSPTRRTRRNGWCWIMSGQSPPSSSGMPPKSALWVKTLRLSSPLQKNWSIAPWSKFTRMRRTPSSTFWSMGTTWRPSTPWLRNVSSLTTSRGSPLESSGNEIIRREL